MPSIGPTILVDRYVLDASVAIKWHLTDEEHAESAAALLIAYGNGDAVSIAPTQTRFEVASAIALAAEGRSPRLTGDAAEGAICQFLTLEIELHDSDSLIQAAVQIVFRHKIAFYDALYVALSQELDAPLATAVRRLFRRIEDLPSSICIGDLAIPGSPTG